MRNSHFSDADALTLDDLSTIPVNPRLKCEDILVPTDKVYKQKFVRDGCRETTYLVIRVTRERISDGIVGRRYILLPLRWFVNPSHDSALDVVKDIKGKRFIFDGWPIDCPAGEHRKPTLRKI